MWQSSSLLCSYGRRKREEANSLKDLVPDMPDSRSENDRDTISLVWR